MRYRTEVNFSLVKTAAWLDTCWAPSGLTFIPWAAQETPQVLSALTRQRFHRRPIWDKIIKHVTNCHKSSPGQTSKVLKISPLASYKWIHVTLCFVNWHAGWRKWLSQKLPKLLHAAKLTTYIEEALGKSPCELFLQLQKWSHRTVNSKSTSFCT